MPCMNVALEINSVLTWLFSTRPDAKCQIFPLNFSTSLHNMNEEFDIPFGADYTIEVG